MENTMEKITKVEYTTNYGGLRAWTMQRFIDGKLITNGHLVLKREHFNNLQNFIMHELKNGFEVQIANDSSNKTEDA